MNFHGTTILAVRHKGKAAVAGDGQVTMNNNRFLAVSSG